MTAQTILIVEDEVILQDVYKLVLTSAGHNVHIASNGLQGLDRMKKVKPTIILLDIFMPVMDGREFLRNVDLTKFPGTKVIVYSNLSDKKTESEMMELGASKFILKASMTPSDLLTLVDTI